jgi:hypothetical protein
MPTRSRRLRFRTGHLITGAFLATSLLTVAFYFLSRNNSPVKSEAAANNRSVTGSLFVTVPDSSIEAPARPSYPYSIIRGGIVSGNELAKRVAEDPVVAKHYSDFNVARARIVHAPRDKLVYVAYRLDQQVFWTKKRLLIRKGESLVTDGTHYARARCGNRITDSPVPPTSPLEPSIVSLDPPSLPPSTPWTDSPSVSNPPLIVTAPPAMLPVPPIFISSSPRPIPPESMLPPISGPPSWTALPTPSESVPPVPEPPSIWLLGVGIASTALQIWRNRHKS